jgi:hypothetical protein
MSSTYSVYNIKIDRIYSGEVQTASISGAYAVDLSTGNNFVFTLTGSTTLTYTNPSKSTYNILVKGGTHSIELGTGSNWLSSEGDAISATGSIVISGIYDGTDMWVAYSENYLSI